MLTLATDNSFFFSFLPQENLGTFEADFTFYNEDDVSDFIVVNIKIIISPSGQTEIEVNQNSINSISPNPCSNNCSIDYSINTDFETANIEVYNVLGAKVKNIELSIQEDNILIDTTD